MLAHISLHSNKFSNRFLNILNDQHLTCFDIVHVIKCEIQYKTCKNYASEIIVIVKRLL